ncbi:MAG: 3-oxoacyl-ACP reductase FabG [Treponema sp.]|jgi:3-oxoacyl-[acyl-carrier protein] reductase|nr:3-oxoacyl-ACP reductase FabG [Treponema sp.]
MRSHVGKRAIVTGAAQGIGRGIAARLAREGAGVALCDLNRDKAEAEAEKLRREGFAVTAIQADIGKIGDIFSMVEQAAGYFGGLDILVNNAGLLDSSSILDMKEEVWDRVLGVNLKGVFFACQAAIPHLKRSPAPRIVNVSSVAGRMGGYEAGLAYSASKGGILSLTMGMARQLAPFKITVNALCPGTTESDMIKQWAEEQVAGLKARIPLGRLGSVDDMAAAVAFLTSDEAGFITGHFLDVNGGMHMG